MRVLGQIKGQWEVILYDLKSNHPFLDSSQVSKMNLPMVTTQSFEVKIANGDEICTKGTCNVVSLMIQGQFFKVHLNVHLGGCDVV